MAQRKSKAYQIGYEEGRSLPIDLTWVGEMLAKGYNIYDIESEDFSSYEDTLGMDIGAWLRGYHGLRGTEKDIAEFMRGWTQGYRENLWETLFQE